MKVFETEKIRNITLLGAPKSGKTSLAEAMMFEGKVTKRRGSIEQKNTVSDYHDIEKEKQNSVYSTILHTEWKDQKINIVDTPGYDDFIGDIVSSLRVADTAVLLFNAQHGVEVATELFWSYAGKYERPVIMGINQVDHEKAQFDKTLEASKSRFGKKVTLVQYPYNPGEKFNSIIDLLKMVMYKFPAEGGKPEKLPIPDEEKEKAEQLHNELVEAAAENDESLMELFFDKGSLDEDEMRQGIKTGMLKRELFPVFCLSAKRNMGSGRMMGFIDNVAPSAAEMPPPETEKGDKISIDPNGPACAFVFKTFSEPHIGEMTFFKLYSGKIKGGQELKNAQTGTTERINQLFIMDGKNRNQVDELVAGDFGATVKLKNTHINNTLNEGNSKLKIKPIDFPPPRLHTAIVARKEGDEEKLAEALHDLAEQDPTIGVEFSHELKQTILQCQGELHLNIIQWNINNIYGIEVDFVKPKVPYRETIEGTAGSTYRHKKQSGGAGQFAEVYLQVEPYREGMKKPSGINLRQKEEIDLKWGGKLVFFNSIVGGAIDQKFIPSVLKGVIETMEEGPITGSYVRDLAVCVYDGKMHPVDSNDIAFKIASAHAFTDAFKKARPKLMEPVYEVEVIVPEDMMGDVMTDLQSRRALIQGMDSDNSVQKIKARVPLAELYRYSTKLRSITQGKASHTRSFAGYSPVPPEIQQELMKQRESAKAT